MKLNKGEIKSIAQVWELLDRGETIYWSSEAYKVFVTRDTDPHTTSVYEPRRLVSRNGYILDVRCISNYFGSILFESELNQLFVKE